MQAVRPILQVSINVLLLGTLVAALIPVARSYGVLPVPYDTLDWTATHGQLLLWGSLLPGLFAFHLASVGRRTGKEPEAEQMALLLGALVTGAVLVTIAHLGIGALAGWPMFDRFASLVALLVVFVAALIQFVALRTVMPDGSLVDVDADPLTKGDDASLKHIKFAHIFLPIGLVFLAIASAMDPGTWQHRLHATGIHVGLIGYALLSIYGLGHLLIPRFSTVPAIAAGAIKGELYSSLLGIVLLGASFLVGAQSGLGKGLLVGGGSFVFLGMFIYMGVLGANIMKNKSVTQRVTPEFVYIPWTFAGIFWLISGILMGLFLNAVPDVLADRAPGLRFLHVHSALLGGFAFLLIGWAHRLLPEWEGQAPPPFGRSRLPFLLANVAVGAALYGMLEGRDDFVLGAALGLFLCFAWTFAALRSSVRKVVSKS